MNEMKTPRIWYVMLFLAITVISFCCVHSYFRMIKGIDISPDYFWFVSSHMNFCITSLAIFATCALVSFRFILRKNVPVPLFFALAWTAVTIIFADNCYHRLNNIQEWIYYGFQNEYIGWEWTNWIFLTGSIVFLFKYSLGIDFEITRETKILALLVIVMWLLWWIPPFGDYFFGTIETYYIGINRMLVHIYTQVMRLCMSLMFVTLTFGKSRTFKRNKPVEIILLSCIVISVILLVRRVQFILW